MKCLLEDGDDINRTNDNKYTALHHAVFLNQLNILDYMIKFYKENKITMVMLQIAVKEMGDMAIIELIIKKMTLGKEEI